MIPVVVTTDSTRRGVFFGYVEDDTLHETMTLHNARMAVYWSEDVRGVMGLAEKGPTRNCRISPAVGKFQVNGVTAVMNASDEATKAWEKAPWK